MIMLVEHGGATAVLPLAGIVAAGNPIEAIEQQEAIDVPEEMLGAGDYFALKVCQRRAGGLREAWEVLSRCLGGDHG